MEEEEIMSKHNRLREILVEYGCKEFGDCIIDDICLLFNYPDTIDLEYKFKKRFIRIKGGKKWKY